VSDFSNERDPDTLHQLLSLAMSENSRLHERLQKLVAENAELRGEGSAEQLALELKSLEEQVNRLQDRIYGDSSERRPRTKETDRVVAKAKRGHGPTPQPKLAVIETLVELDSDERTCPACKGELSQMGIQSEDSEMIDVLREHYFVRKVKRQKYRCTCGIGVTTAPAPIKHIARGRYSLDFAAYAMTNKFGLHIPLDRQRRQMERLGLTITTQTLWDQIEAVAKILEPVHDALRYYILSGDVIGADETWWRLLSKSSNKRWWVWALSSENAVCYDIAPSRSAKTAKEIIGDFEGTIVCDGYKAYETLAKTSDKIRLALCWAHARRKFVEAEPNYPQCEKAIELIGELFAIDRDSQSPANLEGDLRTETAELRQRLRSERAPPILEALREWALAQRGLPKSGLRKAIDYLLGHWKGLTAFLDDPYVPLDNNATERALRGLVVGRKNHYGSRSERGTEVAAICYSLIDTAVLNGFDPHAYITSAVYGAETGIDPLLILPTSPLWQQHAR
jgi:transposase